MVRKSSRKVLKASSPARKGSRLAGRVTHIPAPVVKHGKASGISMLIVGVLTLLALALVRSGSKPEPVTEVGIEHQQSLTLAVTVSMDKAKGGIAEFGNEGKENIAVSVPDTWHRREVRGATLDAVTSDASTFGFTRWHLPASAVISFSLPTSPDHLKLHNPSNVPLQIRLARVYVRKGETLRDIVLVKEKPVRLW